ncbi:MAG: hypothetical protein LBI55_04200 [Oscillospiraceae bacterium]|jgi:hypothetical protein|nr:hypothetical protein [Oscillospiraceae bacterium]
MKSKGFSRRFMALFCAVFFSATPAINNLYFNQNAHAYDTHNADPRQEKLIVNHYNFNVPLFSYEDEKFTPDGYLPSFNTSNYIQYQDLPGFGRVFSLPDGKVATGKFFLPYPDISFRKIAVDSPPIKTTSDIYKAFVCKEDFIPLGDHEKAEDIGLSFKTGDTVEVRGFTGGHYTVISNKGGLYFLEEIYFSEDTFSRVIPGLVEDIKILDVENNYLKTIVKALENEKRNLEDFISEIQSLKNRQQEEDQTRLNLDEQYQILLDKNKELESEVQKLTIENQQKSDESSEQIQLLQHQIHELKRINEKLFNSASKSKNIRSRGLEDFELEQQPFAFNESQKDNESLEFKDFQEEEQEQESVFNESQKDNESLEFKDFQEEEQEKNEFEEYFQQKESGFVDQKLESSQILEENKTLSYDLAESQEKVRQLEEQNEALSNSLAESQEKIAQLEEQNETLSNNLTESQNDLELLKKYNLNNEEILKNSEEIAKVNEFSIKQLREKNETLSNNLAKSQEEVKQLQKFKYENENKDLEVPNEL